MDSAKLEISGSKTNGDPPAVQATYRQIPETDMEDDVLSRPKSLVKVSKTSTEADGAEEKMLPEDATKVTINSNMDHVDLKGSPGDKQNGDAKLDIGDLKTQFVGMTKEELMKYANDPFWMRLRWFLFITFWLLWAAMLVGAVLIIYAAPKCDPPPPKTWWQQGPLAKLGSDIPQQESIKSLDKSIQGVIVSWTEDTYATFNDSHAFIKLIKQARDQGVNVIVEVEPAVSDVWFAQSESHNADFSDYYIWRGPKSTASNGNPEPPNNWRSPTNASSWKYSATRKEFYYSPFEKPHLNFRNANITEQFAKVIENFIAAGASGISIRNAAFLLVDTSFEDEVVKANTVGFDLNNYGFYTHTKTENLMELGPLLYKWKKVIRNLTEHGPLLVDEDLANVESYKFNGTLVVDLPLQSHMFSKSTFLVNETVDNLNYMLKIDKIDWPLWKTNTTAVPKDVLDIITYLLPGTPLTNSTTAINEHLLKIRQSPSIMRGDCKVFGIQNNTVLVYMRETPGNPGVLVAVNPSNDTKVINIPLEVPPLSETPDVTVQLFSSNYNETTFMDVNKKHDAAAIPISSKSAIVLSYVPPKPTEE